MPSTAESTDDHGSTPSGGGLVIEDLGHMGYQAAWDLQKIRVGERVAGAIPDTLLLVEHDPVLTYGRGTDPANILDARFPAYEIERGGDVTYHGPGQLVGYPIVNIKERQVTIGGHLRGLETLLIRILAELDVPAHARSGATGVWVGDPAATGLGGPDGARKIASIGVAFDRWVSYHGFALNVCTDLDHFTAINPCGFRPDIMTSVSAELGREVGLDEVKGVLARHLGGTRSQ